MSRFTQWLFRPRFSPVEVLLLIGAVTSASRKQFLLAALLLVGGMAANWLWSQISREPSDR